VVIVYVFALKGVLFMERKDITSILRREVAPALGCTGPTAYALAMARCRPYMTAEPRLIRVYLSPTFLKIGFGVATPGTPEPGIAMAAAIGLFGGDYTLGLEVLNTATHDDIEAARNLLRENRVKVMCDWSKTGIYVRGEVETSNETISAVVAGMYDSIISVSVNGKEVFHADRDERNHDLDIRALTPEEIFAYVRSINPDEIGFLKKAIEMNKTLALDGLKNKYGLNIGRTLLAESFAGTPPADLYDNPLKYLPDDLALRSKILVTAGSDARMGGSELPAMTIMGDGNQGITATLPVALAGEKYGVSEETVIRSLAMSYLIAFYIKANIGRTAAICHCVASASAGVAASIAFMRGGSDDRIKAAVKNVLAPLAGLLCDGAKPGCALKMGLAVTEAISAAVFALNGVEVGFYDGVADETLEYTLKNVSVLAQQSQSVLETGMANIALEKEARYNMAICAE